MTMTDPIADMLTRIRNGLKAERETVDIPGSTIKTNIAKVLKSEGYIKNYKVLPDKRQGVIKIILKYDEEGASVIQGLKRVSKPSRRVYSGYDEIPEVLNGFGINIVSTSKGLMSDSRARKMRLGGEIICSVW
ncbi:MAG: 30S ribosomal protein S8 [Deltaproteobacteria bacterium]|nr:30S ribosomal protein S8 [Deltaproteobacteria bacterium]